MPRVRLDSQNPAHSARALLNGNGTQPQAIQLISGESTGKTKPLTIVIHNEY